MIEVVRYDRQLTEFRAFGIIITDNREFLTPRFLLFCIPSETLIIFTPAFSRFPPYSGSPQLSGTGMTWYLIRAQTYLFIFLLFLYYDYGARKRRFEYGRI